MRKNLRKNKARSAFILEKDLELQIFKFEPNEWIEIVNEGEKSVWARPFEEYLNREKEAKLKEEERIKSN